MSLPLLSDLSFLLRLAHKKEAAFFYNDVKKFINPNKTFVWHNFTDMMPSLFRHVLVNNFKFGVVYQRIGQTTEEALFGNRNHSPAMERFLESIGQYLSDFYAFMNSTVQCTYMCVNNTFHRFVYLFTYDNNRFLSWSTVSLQIAKRKIFLHELIFAAFP